MSADDSGSVRITNREIYDGLIALQRSVEHLTGALQERSHTVMDHESRLRVVEVNQANPKRTEDHERRLRFLEKVAWATPPSLILSLVALVLKVHP